MDSVVSVVDLASKIINFEKEEIDGDHHYIRGAVHVSMLLFVALYAIQGRFLLISVMMFPFLFFEYLWWRIRRHNAEDDHVGTFAHFWEQIAG